MLNYKSLLDSVSSSIRTNLSNEAIANLVQGQLRSGGAWTIERLGITGSGEMGLPSYFMPGYNLYFELLEDSIAESRAFKIHETLK